MKMNELDVYYECGFKAGQAMTRNDASLAKFQREWYQRAVALESDGKYRNECEAKYYEGYKEGRGLK